MLLVIEKERLLTYGVDSPGQSRGISPLQGGGDEGLKVEGGLHLRKASRGLQGGLKGASRGLEGGFKGLHLRKASRGLEGGFNGASRGLEGGLKPSEGEGGFGGLEGGLKGASRGLEGGFKGLHLRKASSPLQAPLKPP